MLTLDIRWEFKKSWIVFSKSKFRSEGHVNDFWNTIQFWLCEEREDSRPLFLPSPLLYVIKVFFSLFFFLYSVTKCIWTWISHQSWVCCGPSEMLTSSFLFYLVWGRLPLSSESCDFYLKKSEEPGPWWCGAVAYLPACFSQRDVSLRLCEGLSRRTS